MKPIIKLNTFSSKDELAKACAKLILAQAKLALEINDSFHGVLAGGSSPAKAYQYLAKKSQNQEINCSKWHLYLGDERVLPVGDSERNSTMIESNWLNAANFKAKSVMPKWHPMPVELGLEAAKTAYQESLAPLKQFDLVLLGIGEDGHTASLFPNKAMDLYADVIAVFDSPKPPLERLSLNYSRLIQSKHLVILISGKNKLAINDEIQKFIRRYQQLLAQENSLSLSKLLILEKEELNSPKLPILNLIKLALTQQDMEAIHIFMDSLS